MAEKQTIRRIATEEAFSIPEVAAELRNVARSPGNSLDLELAALANDRLAEVIGRHPDRFAGLASFAPQSPKRAAVEMERAVKKLKLNGFVVNSHTHNEYPDYPKYWPILEAAEALDACIYIHPRAASEGLDGPMRDYNMHTALWSYGVEVSTHAVRLILSGVFDRFPNLTICIGHMGDAVHFWLWRIDFMSRRGQETGQAPKLKLKPSEYFRCNFVITNSGQNLIRPWTSPSNNWARTMFSGPSITLISRPRRRWSSWTARRFPKKIGKRSTIKTQNGSFI